MDVLHLIHQRARVAGMRIVLPEGSDSRTVEAASVIAGRGLARVTLLGDPEKIKSLASRRSAFLNGVAIVDPAQDGRREDYAARILEARKHKGMTPEKAAELASNPLYFGTMMLEAGEADGFLAGAAHATADTLRPALQIIKTASGERDISSFFLMIVPGSPLADGGVALFADCGLNPDPDARLLAKIAVQTARSGAALFDMEPRVAMLSFSTKGSAKHARVDKVREAARLAQEMAPDLQIEGELQADAALVETVGKSKAPGSKVAGRANILIFPDLDSGNIGYKLVQRFARAQALGPILQGLRLPVNDLSRGASVSDIVNMAAITALQASALTVGK